MCRRVRLTVGLGPNGRCLKYKQVNRFLNWFICGPMGESAFQSFEPSAKLIVGNSQKAVCRRVRLTGRLGGAND
jgi:hypothetical protein